MVAIVAAIRSNFDYNSIRIRPQSGHDLTLRTHNTHRLLTARNIGIVDAGRNQAAIQPDSESISIYIEYYYPERRFVHDCARRSHFFVIDGRSTVDFFNVNDD